MIDPKRKEALAAWIGLAAVRTLGEQWSYAARLIEGHQLVVRGPYRLVRHPGYVGLAGWALASPLLLLSARAIWPALLAAAWIVLRTALEDATLRRELEGYAAYARRVRWRLVPGIW